MVASDTFIVKESGKMKWDWESFEKVKILALEGRFDNYTAPQIRDLILSVAKSDAAQLVVDLKGVTFVDSTALATLVQAMKWCRQQGGDLRLCNLRPEVRMIFELTRLDKAFEIFPARRQATAAFALDNAGVD